MFTPDVPTFQTLRRVPLATIDAIVSARLGTTRVKGNAQPAVFNRQIAMYLAKHVGGWSTTAIGKFYNGRHHTTVLWALRRIECLRARHARIEGLLFSLTQEIQSRHLQEQPQRGPSLAEATERQLLSFALDDDFLELLTDRIADRLKSRGVQ
jgi:hypothetical protein